MKPFKIYYDDNTTFQGPPGLAPVRGVICILQLRADGRHNLLSQKSHYVHDGKEWISCTWDDVEEYLLDRREVDIVVIRGRVVGNIEFSDIYDKAKVDRDKESLD